MSENQAPGVGKDDNQTAAALELLKLRGAISDLAIDEGRLKIQESQLQVWVSRYQSEAQDNQDEALATKARKQLATLQPQLTSLQEQLARIQSQKAELTEQQQAILAKLNISSIDQARTLTSADSGVAWEPPPPIAFKKRQRRRQSSGRPVFLVSGLLIILVVGVVAVTVFHLSFSPASLLTDSTPFATPTPSGPVFSPNGLGPNEVNCSNCYNPEQIQQAFGLNPLYRQGLEGQGQTIVILGLGNTSSLKADLTQFDLAWGLPDPTLQVIQPHGPPTPYTCPDNEDDLQFENTLDVEWAHAIAPAAKIVLLIGDNSGGTTSKEHCIHWSLLDDVTYALDHHLGNIISISYAGSELGDLSQTASERAQNKAFYQEADAVFKRAATMHVTVIASSGDEGATSRDDLTKTDSYWKQANVEWPASDPYVLGVGGTSLDIADPTGTYNDEAVWFEANESASGGGVSAVFSEPAYQKQVANQKMFKGKRGVPDVAFPAEDFLVYESEIPWEAATTTPALTHWYLAGGTSLSTPCWAGLIALANQLYGKPLGFIQPALYGMNGEYLNDITVGNNTFAGVTGYEAQPGYDLVTGWGTPVANRFIPALIQATISLSPGCKRNQHLCTWQPPTS
jgi:subtilase family serine protease/transposase-like protein